MKSPLIQARLHEVLNYDRETGTFTWKKSTSGRPIVGKVAGSDDGNGYISIGIDGTNYRAHRLAWLYVHGSFPPNQIDHKDGRRSNNAIANLREATNEENQQNQRVRGSGKPLGVHFHKATGRWSASIGVNGKQKWLGRFATEAGATSTYLAAKAEFHPFQTITATVVGAA
ncbi:MAG: HNH endonuclease signature motif containing protein [Janthinobacterium svalbardensis]